MFRHVWLIVPAVAFVSFSSPLLAATAEEIWAEWQDLATSTGQKMTAESQESLGGTLTLKGVSSLAEFEGGSSGLSIGQVRLVEMGNGDVSIELEKQMQITSNTQAEGEDVKVVMTVSHEGLNIVASGTPEERKYAYEGASLLVRVDDVQANGTTIPMDLTVTVQDFISDYLISSGDDVSVSSDATVAAMAFVMDFQDPDTGEKGKVDFAATDLKVTSEGTVNAYMAGDPAAMLSGEVPTTVSMTHGGTVYAFDIQAGPESATMNGSSSGGQFDMSMGKDGLSYDVTSTGVSFQMMAAEVPIPIELTAQEMGAKASFPMLAGDQPQNFGLGLTMGNLSVSETLWGMIDPQQILPRDPMNLMLDVTGTATLFTDLFAIENPEEVPGEVNSVNISNLNLKLAGAELNGSGAFEVDNSSAGPIPGAPNLIGKLNLSADGVNGLIDKLAAVGLLSNDDVMGARMMMSMVAQPGEGGGDSLKSEVELTPGGGLVVNGMKFQ